MAKAEVLSSLTDEDIRWIASVLAEVHTGYGTAEVTFVFHAGRIVRRKKRVEVDERLDRIRR